MLNKVLVFHWFCKRSRHDMTYQVTWYIFLQLPCTCPFCQVPHANSYAYLVHEFRFPNNYCKETRLCDVEARCTSTQCHGYVVVCSLHHCNRVKTSCVLVIFWKRGSPMKISEDRRQLGHCLNYISREPLVSKKMYDWAFFDSRM